MDCDSIGSIENHVSVPLTLHVLSMAATIVVRNLKATQAVYTNCTTGSFDGNFGDSNCHIDKK